MRAELRRSDRRAEERTRRGELRAVERRPEKLVGIQEARGDRREEN
jgi:hypothetical protein